MEIIFEEFIKFEKLIPILKKFWIHKKYSVNPKQIHKSKNCR